MGGIKIWHIVVLVIAFVILFGWKNLPNMARSIGESMRVFKSEVDQMKDDGESRKSDRDNDHNNADAVSGTTTQPTQTRAVLDESTPKDSAREEYDSMRERGQDGNSPNPERG